MIARTRASMASKSASWNAPRPAPRGSAQHEDFRRRAWSVDLLRPACCTAVARRSSPVVSPRWATLGRRIRSAGQRRRSGPNLLVGGRSRPPMAFPADRVGSNRVHRRCSRPAARDVVAAPALRQRPWRRKRPDRRRLLPGRAPSVDREVVRVLVAAGALLLDLHQHVVAAATTRRSGTSPGVIQRGPSVSYRTTRYWIASLAVADPAGRLHPDLAPPVCLLEVADRPRASPASTGSVAAGLTLPVEVLMKSAPAAIARTLARRTLSYVSSSPVSRITLRWASPQASLTSTISSKTVG